MIKHQLVLAHPSVRAVCRNLGSISDASAGTKRHQRLREALTKRTPAILATVRKFNSLRQTLVDLKPADSDFPLPDALPEDWTALRESDSLFVDVWLHETIEVPKWVSDPKARQGIKGLHMKKRCAEEQRRLKDEIQNLILWVWREIVAVTLAIHHAQGKLPFIRFLDGMIETDSKFRLGTPSSIGSSTRGCVNI